MSQKSASRSRGLHRFFFPTEAIRNGLASERKRYGPALASGDGVLARDSRSERAAKPRRNGDARECAKAI